MKIDPSSRLLVPVSYKPSPHYNERPADATIDMIVVHNISLPPGQFGTGVVEQFFCGTLDASGEAYFETIKELKVSAHLLINRQGEITQFVPFSQRAWHAGQSQFAGRTNCNDFSVGIELEGTDDLLYEAIQYQHLAAVIKALLAAYPAITRARIVGHSDIAPGRKTDPGASFDWTHLDCLLTACSA